MRTRPRSFLIREFLVQNVPTHPQDIVDFAATTFGISRQAVRRHIQLLLADHSLAMSGTKRSVRYELVPHKYSIWLELSSNREEDVVFDKYVLPHLKGLPPNIERICYHGFTEICNNAIDHSGGTGFYLEVIRTARDTTLSLLDDGVGIFRKIQNALNLPSQSAAIIELAKGKFTTDPVHHSGQGIFFTSRMFDTFSILSGDLFFSHAGPDSDWLLETRADKKGTYVEMTIDAHTPRTAKEVFDRFSSTDGDYSFSKTHFPLSLAQHEDGILISRSQAKRVLARFENFAEVLLDFKGVNSIGQAFADEIFRVFRNHHPDVKLVWINAGPEVTQMINRALGNERPTGQTSLFPP